MASNLEMDMINIWIDWIPQDMKIQPEFRYCDSIHCFVATISDVCRDPFQYKDTVLPV